MSVLRSVRSLATDRAAKINRGSLAYWFTFRCYRVLGTMFWEVLRSWPPPRRTSGGSVPRCKYQITKQFEIRFHAMLGDGAREVRLAWGIG